MSEHGRREGEREVLQGFTGSPRAKKTSASGKTRMIPHSSGCSADSSSPPRAVRAHRPPCSTRTSAVPFCAPFFDANALQSSSPSCGGWAPTLRPQRRTRRPADPRPAAAALTLPALRQPRHSRAGARPRGSALKSPRADAPARVVQGLLGVSLPGVPSGAACGASSAAGGGEGEAERFRTKKARNDDGRHRSPPFPALLPPPCVDEAPVFKEGRTRLRLPAHRIVQKVETTPARARPARRPHPNVEQVLSTSALFDDAGRPLRRRRPLLGFRLVPHRLGAGLRR